MASYSFDGKISIEPTLNFAQIKKVRADAFALVVARYNGKPPRWMGEQLDPKNASSFLMKEFMPLDLSITESEQETEQGVLQVKVADALIPSREVDGELRYSMETQVERLIKIFPKHTFTGEVTAVNTETMEAVKLVVKDGTAKETGGEAWIHFEDGTKIKASSLL